MSYYEVRMVNNDLFKAAESPEKWQCIDVYADGGTGGYLFSCARFTDIRNNKPVMVNTEHIVSMREVSDPKDSTVGLIADQEFVDDTAKLAGQILNSFLGGGSKKEEVITIDNKDSVE